MKKSGVYFTAVILIFSALGCAGEIGRVREIEEAIKEDEVGFLSSLRIRVGAYLYLRDREANTALIYASSGVTQKQQGC